MVDGCWSYFSMLGHNMVPVTQKPLFVMEGNYGLMLSKMIQNQHECLWHTF